MHCHSSRLAVSFYFFSITLLSMCCLYPCRKMKKRAMVLPLSLLSLSFFFSLPLSLSFSLSSTISIPLQTSSPPAQALTPDTASPDLRIHLPPPAAFFRHRTSVPPSAHAPTIFTEWPTRQPASQPLSLSPHAYPTHLPTHTPHPPPFHHQPHSFGPRSMPTPAPTPLIPAKRRGKQRKSNLKTSLGCGYPLPLYRSLAAFHTHTYFIHTYTYGRRPSKDHSRTTPCQVCYVGGTPLPPPFPQQRSYLFHKPHSQLVIHRSASHPILTIHSQT